MGYNKQQAREYNVRRREERRRMCLQKLGGKCIKCGNTVDLEFDHIDPKTVLYRISEILTHKLTKLLKELEKCQLLCKTCHREKTTRIDRVHADQKHGTLSSYRWCKCDLCKKVKSDYMKTYIPTYGLFYNRK